MDRQERLLEAVKIMHGTHQRKYTGEPYWYHLVEVADILRPYDIPYAVEIAYCHDLLEDTDTTAPGLINIIQVSGYEYWEALYITSVVIQLTDVYTTEAYPHLNRMQRKGLEVMRLSKTTPIAQTVKYADLISNTTSIMEHDPDFFVVYQKEKLAILFNCSSGHSELRDRAFKVVFGES